MTDNPVPGTPAVPDVESRLHEVAKLLRDSGSLDPAARRALAALVDELGDALRSAPVPAAEVTHLAQTTAQLAEALHHRHDRGTLALLRDRLERGVLAAESRAPFLTGLVRQVLDALAGIGI